MLGNCNSFLWIVTSVKNPTVFLRIALEPLIADVFGVYANLRYRRPKI